MVIKLRKGWRGYRAGVVLKMGDGAANVLIRRGLAVAIDPSEGGEAPRPPAPASKKDPFAKPTKKPAKRRATK